MRVFVTGASGYIGNAVAVAFRRAGHNVKGLVRKESDAIMLAKEEITPVLGDLSRQESYLSEASTQEVLVHCAFEYSPEGVKRDLSVIDTFLKIASSSISPKAIIYTSGCWIYGNSDKIVDEETPINPLVNVTWRPQHEAKVLNATSPQLRTIVIRPGCVFGGKGSLTSLWFDSLKSGSVQVAGDGKNHWAMIHKDDLAEAYVLAAEKEITNTIFNVTDSTHYTVKQMAEAVAQIGGIAGKVSYSTPQEAEKIHGPLAHGLLVNQKLSNERAMRLLGWKPRHLGFIEEIELYYSSWKSFQKKI